MSVWQLAIQSLRYYWRTNFSVALGVAAATAVLTGALIVGDSMRYSLRSLTIERLGAIDDLLVSDGFFRAKLADEIRNADVFKESYQNVTPAILFPGGTVEFKRKIEPPSLASSELETDSSSESEPSIESEAVEETQTVRAGSVTVLGITDSFWEFGDARVAPSQSLEGDTAIINQALAKDLQISSQDVADGSAKITVRIPKQNQLPADSALGKQDDLIESLVNLTVIQIVPTESLGRFGLHPTQSDPLNVYLPIQLLQNSLQRTVLRYKSDPAQANVLLFSGDASAPPTAAVSQELLTQLQPTLEDYGLTLKRVTQEFGTGDEAPETVFDYWSLSSDQMLLNDETVAMIKTAFPNAKPVLTYLANDIRAVGKENGVPFSMVSAIDFDDAFRPISSENGEPIRSLGENEIVIVDWEGWSKREVETKLDDTLILTYFEPETAHGSQIERQHELQLVDIAKLTEPAEGFLVPRRGPMQPPTFDQRPQITNDPDLTPEVPGVTDAQTIENWDLPFETADRIEPEDDDYWNNYRTTPKAYVSLDTGRRLWNSRFGQTTNFRIPVSAGNQSEIESRLLQELRNHKDSLGMHVVSIKRRGLEASSGSTPFDVLFLALSMFVIGSALILVALLFRLGFQQRASEVGLMAATGFNSGSIRKIWLAEMTLVTLAGALIGILLGIGYAALMIWGLTTWWVGAISRPFLTLHISSLSLVIGMLSGLFVCVATIAVSLWMASRQNVRSLLAGQIETPAAQSDQSKAASKPWLAIVLFLAAIGLAGAATGLSGDAQAGSFMGAGFLVLTALLIMVYRSLRKPDADQHADSMRLNSLAKMNGKRNPLRSTLTIGLVGVASFLIAAVSAFRLAPTEQGTGGFDWVAQSSQPILEDLMTVAGRQRTLGEEHRLTNGTVVLPLRLKPGEDASCNNLYQSTQPQVLGVPPAFVEYFDDPKNAPPDNEVANAAPHAQTSFAWAGSTADSDSERANPWRLLDGTTSHAGTADDPIPVVIDKNTANYSLKIFALNAILKVDYDSGETVHFKVVGFLANTILQGSLIVAENDFKTAFPTVGGYQYFLIKDGLSTVSMPDDEPSPDTSNVSVLEDQLGDYGFDARSAPQLLSNFMAVQNTYLSTFQTLGALGLLLGTFGLAAVQMRSVLERKKELGLMRAVGFSQSRLSLMVLLENTFLLLMGLGVGIGAALFTTLPHWLVGSASVPWLELAVMFAVITAVGLMAGLLGSRLIARMPLLDSLRA